MYPDYASWNVMDGVRAVAERALTFTEDNAPSQRAWELVLWWAIEHVDYLDLDYAKHLLYTSTDVPDELKGVLSTISCIFHREVGQTEALEYIQIAHQRLDALEEKKGKGEGNVN
jgi:hypothetical protein